MVSVENLKIQWGKKGEVQGEKKKKAIFTAKEKKNGKNILQADNRNYLEGRKLGKGERVNF